MLYSSHIIIYQYILMYIHDMLILLTLSYVQCHVYLLVYTIMYMLYSSHICTSYVHVHVYTTYMVHMYTTIMYMLYSSHMTLYIIKCKTCHVYTTRYTFSLYMSYKVRRIKHALLYILRYT